MKFSFPPHLVIWLLTAAAVMVVAQQPKTRTRAERVLRTVVPQDCFQTAGANLHLCRIYDDEGSQVLEFEQAVSNAYFLISGPTPMVEVWMRRQDVGKRSRAMVHAPTGDFGPDEFWGIGISTDPPYVGVRITGMIRTIEDIVYGN